MIKTIIIFQRASYTYRNLLHNHLSKQSGTFEIVWGNVFQLAFACSTSTMETLETGVKYVRSKQLKRQNDVNDVVPEFLF